jgi:molecular chaperone GrpE
MVKRKKLSKLQLEKKIAELESQWKRTLADYHNLEKRVSKERELFVKLANASLIDKLLPVLDSLDKCEEHLKDKGVALASGKFKAVLESEGVKEIKALGEKFNPETMDAFEMTVGPKDQVVEVVLKGYWLQDRVLRPAKVKVGRGGKKDE